MKKLMLATAALGLFATGAQAADPIATRIAVPEVVAAPSAFSWTGFYLGGHIGGVFGNHNWGFVTLTGEPVRFSPAGLVGGIHLGGNYQFNQLVFGLDLALSGSSFTANTLSVANPAVTYGVRANFLSTATGRVGVAVDRAMFYVSGGWAGAQLNLIGRNPGVPDRFSNTSFRSGFTVGAGMNYAITPNWILGLDYKYMNFSREVRNGVTAILGAPYQIDRVTTNIHQAMFTLSYLFSTGGPAAVSVRY